VNANPGVNRRNFISRGARGVIAFSMAPQLSRFAAAQEQTGGSLAPQSADESGPWPMEKRVGFALVGLGQLSNQQLMPAFRVSKKAKLTALVSGDPGKAQRLAQENGIKPDAIYDYESFDRIKDNPEVQVVYVVLPNSMHAEFTVAAARAGKHVLCEKPMEVSVANCRRSINSTRSADRHQCNSCHSERSRGISQYYLRTRRVVRWPQAIEVNLPYLCTTDPPNR
jgi:Oxidoreductase family, NAD-binding Rossmann fold